MTFYWLNIYFRTRAHLATVAEAQGMPAMHRRVLITYMYYISVFVLKKGKKSLGSQMTLYPSRKQEVRRPRRPVRGKVILGPSTFWLLSRSVDLLKKSRSVDRSWGVTVHETCCPLPPLTDCWRRRDGDACCLRSLVCSLQFARPRSHRGSLIHYFSLVKFNLLLFVLL